MAFGRRVAFVVFAGEIDCIVDIDNPAVVEEGIGNRAFEVGRPAEIDLAFGFGIGLGIDRVVVAVVE